MNYSALIVAAGQGKRMNLGYNKVFLELRDGKTILESVVDIFMADTRCKQVVIVMSREEMLQCVSLNETGKVVYVVGGKTRQESVCNGLMAINQDYVLVHDGARPYLDQSIIDRVIEGLKTSQACIPVVRVKDTIKVVKDGYVYETPVRENLVMTQTPQGFNSNLIIDCHKKARDNNDVFTDEAHAVEKYTNIKVKVVDGSYSNIKITNIEEI